MVVKLNGGPSMRLLMIFFQQCKLNTNIPQIISIDTKKKIKNAPEGGLYSQVVIIRRSIKKRKDKKNKPWKTNTRRIKVKW